MRFHFPGRERQNGVFDAERPSSRTGGDGVFTLGAGFSVSPDSELR